MGSRNAAQIGSLDWYGVGGFSSVNARPPDTLQLTSQRFPSGSKTYGGNHSDGAVGKGSMSIDRCATKPFQQGTYGVSNVHQHPTTSYNTRGSMYWGPTHTFDATHNMLRGGLQGRSAACCRVYNNS